MSLKRHSLKILIGVAVAAVLALQFFWKPLFSEEPPSLDDQFAHQIPYNLNEPTEKFKLKDRLKEISGLCMLDADHVLSLQDEEGKVYTLNVRNGDLVDQAEFKKEGDFEGIALVDTTVYALRADGTLYSINRLGSETPEVIKHKNHLNTKNDVEGLGYDPDGNRLLLACKGDPGKGLSGKEYRAIYEHDLATDSLSAEPVFLIPMASIRETLKDPEAVFRPSGIAVHPKTKNIYVIAAVGDLMVVLDRKGAILSMTHMPPKVFKQPEGIAFLDNGDLLISNEAHSKGGNANLLYFKQGTTE